MALFQRGPVVRFLQPLPRRGLLSVTCQNDAVEGRQSRQQGFHRELVKLVYNQQRLFVPLHLLRPRAQVPLQLCRNDTVHRNSRGCAMAASAASCMTE